MVKQEFEKVNIPLQSYVQLKHISEVTNIPMSRILSQVIESMFALSVNYDKATFQCHDSILSSQVYITIRGYNPRVSVYHEKLPENATEQDADKLIAEKTTQKINEDLAKEGI